MSVRYKNVVIALIAIVAGITVTKCSSESKTGDVQYNLDQSVIDHIQKVHGVDIRTKPYAYDELGMHVEECGTGVIRCDCKPDTDCSCLPKDNKCQYQVAIDQNLLSNPAVKTGYIDDPNIYLNNGNTFYLPTYNDPAPDQWSFLDLGMAKNVKINNQDCGDCWSQATTKAFEYMIAAHDQKLVELSVQTQISTCSDHGSCNGGYMSAADFLIKHGNPFETQDPYKGYNTSCKFDMNQDPPFDYVLDDAPWVGASQEYSRAKLMNSEPFNTGSKVKAIKQAMYEMMSPAVVTISAINSSGGVITSCSAINSGGNHMQAVVGWYQQSGMEVAVVNNSWGIEHGQNGFTHIKWECGDGKLNRGLGVSARVYERQTVCPNQPVAFTGPDTDYFISESSGALLGRVPENKQTCTWSPMVGLRSLDPSGCLVFAQPKVTTEYHVTAKTECGEKSAMVLVRPIGYVTKSFFGGQSYETILTPHGEIQWPTGGINVSNLHE